MNLRIRLSFERFLLRSTASSTWSLVPKSAAAEAWAAVRAVDLCDGIVRFGTYCAAVVAVMATPVAAAGPKMLMGGDNRRIGTHAASGVAAAYKVAGHTEPANHPALKESWFDAVGNALADVGAKKGGR